MKCFTSAFRSFVHSFVCKFIKFNQNNSKKTGIFFGEIIVSFNVSKCVGKKSKKKESRSL